MHKQEVRGGEGEERRGAGGGEGEKKHWGGKKEKQKKGKQQKSESTVCMQLSMHAFQCMPNRKRTGNMHFPRRRVGPYHSQQTMFKGSGGTAHCTAFQTTKWFLYSKPPRWPCNQSCAPSVPAQSSTAFRAMQPAPMPLHCRPHPPQIQPIKKHSSLMGITLTLLYEGNK